MPRVPTRPTRGGNGPWADADASSDPPSEPAKTPPPPSDRPFPRLDVIGRDEFDDDDDDDLDDEDFEDDEELEGEEFDEPRLILITGASGHLAQKLRAAWNNLYELVLIDQVANPDDPDIVLADLAEMDEGWLTHFHGVDTVVHLAADTRVGGGWEDLTGPNLDALVNILNASVLAGVERVIYASSADVMGGYRELEGMKVTPDLPARPDGVFGALKLVGERLGRSFASAFDITFVALRLGRVQPGENRPETLPDDWARSMWLSNGDMLNLFECAVEAELGERQFVVVNGMSNNRGMCWDLGATSALLEYAPRDDAYREEL